MPVVGRVGVGPASPGDPAVIAQELFDLRLQINRLPRRASMHAAHPTDRGEFVGWEIPVVGLRDQRVFYSQIVIPFARSRRALKTPAPRPVAFVHLADVAGIGTL